MKLDSTSGRQWLLRLCFVDFAKLPVRVSVPKKQPLATVKSRQSDASPPLNSGKMGRSGRGNKVNLADCFFHCVCLSFTLHVHR